MKTYDVARMLDDLASMRDRLTHLDEKYELAKETILKPVQIKLDRLDRQQEDKTKQLKVDATKLEAAIKEAIVEAGETVRGEALMGVFYNPREKWDGKILEGLAIIHPDVLKARTYSEPSAQIRKTGDKT